MSLQWDNHRCVGKYKCCVGKYMCCDWWGYQPLTALHMAQWDRSPTTSTSAQLPPSSNSQCWEKGRVIWSPERQTKTILGIWETHRFISSQSFFAYSTASLSCEMWSKIGINQINIYVYRCVSVCARVCTVCTYVCRWALVHVHVCVCVPCQRNPSSLFRLCCWRSRDLNPLWPLAASSHPSEASLVQKDGKSPPSQWTIPDNFDQGKKKGNRNQVFYVVMVLTVFTT